MNELCVLQQAHRSRVSLRYNGNYASRWDLERGRGYVFCLVCFTNNQTNKPTGSVVSHPPVVRQIIICDNLGQWIAWVAFYDLCNILIFGPCRIIPLSILLCFYTYSFVADLGSISTMYSVVQNPTPKAKILLLVLQMN